MSFATHTNLSDGIWLHAFGMADGLFISAILYMVFFSLATLTEAKGRYMTLTFWMLAISLTFFSFYSIYFQHHNQTITTLHYPDWIITASKYAAPIGLLLISELFFRNVSIESYTDFKLLKLLKTIRYISAFVSIVSVVLLTFAHSSSSVLIITQLMFILNLSLSLYINYDHQHTKKRTATSRLLYKNSVLNALMINSIFACAFYSLFLLFNDSVLPQLITFLLVGGYGLIVILITFGMVRYGLTAIERYNELDQTKHKHLVNDLYMALEKNQFFMIYQPKLSLKTAKVSGLESLIRWQHPERGIITPRTFIPIAEKINLINPICQLVIEKSVQKAHNLMQQGYELPISINFSPDNMQPDNIDHLDDCMKKLGVPAHLILIEVSESLLIELNTDKITALNMLQTLNIAVALDDYGVGFSSLSYIRSLGIQQLKIEKGFIKNLESHSDNQVIVKSTLQMSKGLKISVVAEGVENRHTKRQLEMLGCDEIQGYFISPPLNTTQLYQWLETNHSANTKPLESASFRTV